MRALIRRIAAEWEKALLWLSVALLVGAILYQLAGLLRDHEGGTTTAGAAVSQRSLLNEATAFAFLQPPAAPAADLRNPFGFTCKMPAQAQAVAAPTERRAWRRDKTPSPPPPAEEKPAAKVAEKKKPGPPPPAPPPPKRTVSIAYRGVYKGGDEAGRQLAFLSSQAGGAGAAAMAVAGAGQAVAGVTVKTFTPEALVVTAPTGEEVTIALGQQKKILLE